jgi:hypothetical protein
MGAIQMNTETIVLAAYHRAIGRHEKRTGVLYPLTRESCVSENEGAIYDISNQKVATFTCDRLSGPRIRLV